MKGCFTTLFLAFIAAVISAFFGRSCHKDRVEEVLASRISSQIEEEYPEIDVNYDHLTVLVTGQANDQDIATIRSKVKDLTKGNGRLFVDVTPPPLVMEKKNPARFTVIREEGKVILTGTVDSEHTKAILGKTAAVDGITVDNQLKVSPAVAAYPAFGTAVAAIPRLIQSSENAKLEALPDQIRVSGVVANNRSKDQLSSLFHPGKWEGIPVDDRITVASTGVAAAIPPAPVPPRSTPTPSPPTPPEPAPPEPKKPAHFVVQRNDDKLILTGTVDSQQTRDRIADRARLTGAAVDNQLVIGENTAPLPNLGAAIRAIPSLLTAKNGKMEVGPKKVVVSGAVANPKAKEKLLTSFSADKWASSQIVDQLKVEPPPPPKRTIPATFVIAREQERLLMTGSVDSPNTKSIISSAADIEELSKIDNQLKVNNRVKEFPALDAARSGIPVLLDAAENARIEVHPKKVILAGLVDNHAVKRGILDTFPSGRWNGAEVIDQIEVKTKSASPEPAPMPAKAPPVFSWKQTEPNTATLTGTVPNPKIRDALVAAAQKRVGNNGKVIDRLKINDAVMETDWLKAIPVFASQSLPHVKNPVINIDHESAVISGEVPNSTAMNDVSLAFSGIDPPGKIDVNLKVVPPPPPTPPTMARTGIPEVRVAGTGQRIAVSGHVPNKKSHDQIVNIILASEGIDHLDEKLKVTGTIKEEEYLDRLPSLIRGFYKGNVKERELWLKNKQLTLKGVAPNQKIKREALALADPLQKMGVKIVDQIEVEAPKVVMVTPQPPAPQPPAPPRPAKGKAKGKGKAKMSGKSGAPKPPVSKPKGKANDKPTPPKPDPDKPGDSKMAAAPPKNDKPDAPPPPPPGDAAKGETFSVYFGTGEFHIRNSEVRRVNSMLQQARNTRGKILIDGYADQRGSDELNSFLSNERAKRIRQYLISHGIDGDRIISVTGHGEVPGGVKGNYQEYRRTDVRILDN